MKVGNKMGFVKVMSGIAVAAVITGCSSGSSTAPGDTKLSGTAVTVMDPYATNCTVKSGLLRATEVDSANSAGRYVFANVGNVAGPVTATGCIDKASGVALPNLSSPLGGGMVNPITTVVQGVIEQDPTQTVTSASARVRTNLGLPANIDFTTYDPIAAAASGGNAAEWGKVQGITSQLTTTIKVLEGAGSTTAFNAIAAAVNVGPVDLSASTTIHNFASAIPGIDPTRATNAADTIVAVNTKIKTVTDDVVANPTNWMNSLKQMTAATSVAEALAETIATGGTVDTATVDADITTATTSVDESGLTSEEPVLDGDPSGGSGGTSF